MSVDTATLSNTVSAMRPIMPAKDFDTSKRCYIELGFQPRPLTDRLAELRLLILSLALTWRKIQQTTGRKQIWELSEWKPAGEAFWPAPVRPEFR